MIGAIIHSLCRLLGPDNLVSLSTYASAEQDVLNCMVNLSGESILSLVSKLKNDGVIPMQWRVYKPLENATGVMTMSVNTQHILVCNAMTPTVEREEDFNRWYNEEHILLLSKVPTWIQSSRYRLVDSNFHDAPSYLAMHKWGSRAAFESPEYVMATTTPWKFRVVDNVIARERRVYDYVGDMHVTVGVGGNGVVRRN